MKRRYYIYDWAGNQLYTHGSFKSFDDAWAYIMTNWHSEDEYDELFVYTEDEFNSIGVS